MDEFKYLDNRDTSRIYRELIKYPTNGNQLEEIFSNSWVQYEVDSSCLYMGGYEHLSKTIPLRMPVYDFGAAYGFQAWHFRKHARYIAINPSYDDGLTGQAHFRTDNSLWYFGSAQQYFEQFGVEKDSFAIVNAVPDDEVAELVKRYFKFCYIFYV